MSGQEKSGLKVAIIGSGPAGFYTAEALIKKAPDTEVDIIDRLPTPYGLIRGGVAPDHQSIKGVYRRYEKAALAENIHFLGNVEVGSDVEIDQLMSLYDAVVIATGAPLDRQLGLPGEDKAGVIGSAEFVGWYNSHPDFANLDPDFDITSVAVIGNGNVAVDVMRVLAKTAGEMATSDLAPYAASKIHGGPITDIWMFGRRGPIQAKFTPKELGEMGTLERSVALTLPKQIPEEVTGVDDKTALVKAKNLRHLQAFSGNKEDSKPVNLHLRFFASPVEILGEGKVTGLKLEKTRVEDGKCIGTGDYFEIECQMIVPCIGYRSSPLEDLPYDTTRGLFVNDEGLVRDNIYAVGWARRGPTGTIGTNRPDGIGIAERVVNEVKAGGARGYQGLVEHLQASNVRFVRFSDWLKIDRAEVARAEEPCPRVKFHKIEQMLEAAGLE